MGFRLNIALSFVVHALIAAAICATGFGEAVFRLPEPSMLIALIDGLSDDSPASKKAGELNKRNISLQVKKSSPYSGESRHNDLPPSGQETKSGQYSSASIHDIPSSGLINAEVKRAVTDKNIAGSEQAMDSGKGMTLSGGSVSSLQGKGTSDATGNNAVRQINKGDVNPDIYRMIRTAIYKALVYPTLARKRGIEGTVRTEFTISSSGYPENIRIVRSSGYSILDAAARDTVLKASPFSAARGTIEIPITFRLKNN